MAASRRGQPELHVRLPPAIPSAGAGGLTTGTSLTGTQVDMPPISALFLIEFDVKAGYTLSWKASQPGIELEGVVEYKSLPSGLHTVTDDLIYFVHDKYAGLSAFANAPVEDTEVRNARMLAVGVLVPLSYGRLGRAWRHAEALQEIASKLAIGGVELSLLESYWGKNQLREDSTQQEAVTSKESLGSAVGIQEQPKPARRHIHTRSRSASDGTGLLPPGHKLSAFHPAWSLMTLLDTFGPLIFPIHRAALLRKRILISCHAPVREICNFVYDISILSNIPAQTYDMLPLDGPPHRLQPLFTVGVHDIPSLVEDSKPKQVREPTSDQTTEPGTGWIACTTDSILAMKDTLWDVLITMPPPHSTAAKEHIWPTVEYSKGQPVKATQRDLRRYRSLKAGLSRLKTQSSVAIEDPESPTTPRILTNPQSQTQDDPLIEEAEKVVEPLSWAALAYNGFMWWASAGEQARSDDAEEAADDAALLDDVSHPSMQMPRSADLTASLGSLGSRRPSSGGARAPLPPDEAKVELAIITYFHRLTTQLLTKVMAVVESSSDSEDMAGDAEDEDDALLETSDDEPGIRINSEALREMGLDRWSISDAEFVKEVVEVYYGRQAYVDGKSVEVCGIRVC